MPGRSTRPTGCGSFSPEIRPSSSHRPLAAMRSWPPERNAWRGSSGVKPYQRASHAACAYLVFRPRSAVWFRTKPVTARKRKKTTAAKPMRACQRRRNRSSRSFGDTALSRGVIVAEALEKESEPRHAFHRPDRQGRAHDAVDVAVQAVVPYKLRVLELFQERRLADLLPSAFAVDEHADVVDAPVHDDEPGGDQLLFPRFLENPHALAAFAPIALPQLRGGMA